MRWHLCQHVDAGDLIPGSGGCRKMRWGSADKGKRGGVRVIYYEVTQAGQIWLLAIYAKTRQDNLPAHVIRQIKDHRVKS
ncbi:MAG: transcriptional regulator [Xanthomonadales bacterium]|nr:transcriptional regulator [Xanthomonadales bacterium]